MDTLPTGQAAAGLVLISAEHFFIQIKVLVLIPFIGQPDLLFNPGNLLSCLNQTLTKIVEFLITFCDGHLYQSSRGSSFSISSCISRGIISRSSMSRSKISPSMSMISSHIVSKSVEKVSECLIIFCLGVIHPTMNLTRVCSIDASMGDCLAVCLIIPHLHQGGNVGVVRLGFVCHVDIIGTGGDDLGSLVDSAPTGSAAAAFG